VGGDLYDFVEVAGDRLVVIIGDVSGKGVPAALLMARLISEFRTAASRSASPTAILEDLNAGLASHPLRGMFVTATCLVLEAESGRVAYADAGHLPALWYHRETGAVELREGDGGPPLGIVLGSRYPEQELHLGPGDTLLLYTDGVLEARAEAGPPFGMNRTVQVMRSHLPATRDLVEDVLGAVRSHAGGAPLPDDVTLVAIRWRPST
jgi:sigma-B regulation protein RsbU (phosphoserine phosphatase)